MLVAKPADPVLAPAIGPAARVIVREIGPRIAVGAVILAHRPPLAIADIRPPAPPRGVEPFAPASVAAAAAILVVWQILGTKSALRVGDGQVRELCQG